MRAAALCTLLATACTPEIEGPAPVYDPDAFPFFSTPWPSDTRLDDDGTLAVLDFPNPFGVGLIDDYIEALDRSRGFGSSSPVYFGFDGPLDPLLLPLPAEANDEDAALILVDVDPTSPYWGERFPVQWNIHALDSNYLPLHTLTVAPTFGFPLRPATRYALIVTTAVAQRSERFAGVWEPDHPDHDVYADLHRALVFWGLSTDDVAIATVFTTSDPLDEMARIARFLRYNVASPDLNRTVEHVRDYAKYTAWRTHYPSPVFTVGERPYLIEGGGFTWTEDGQPIIASWDDMRLSVCTPGDLSEPPPGGWPVVVYQHGTGGDYRTFCNSNASLETAGLLAERGLIGLGIDQPLHGPRAGPTEETSDLANFNFFNFDSGVSNFRQGAADALYLARALASRQVVLDTPDGTSIPIDPDRVLFMGHSQGGLTGALAIPFFAGDVKAAVISGAGGVLAITVAERKDVLNFQQVIEDIARLEEDEVLTPLHPISALIQTGVEPSDPVNYAPYWFSQRGWWAEHTPVPTLHTSGTLDVNTPYEGAIALAAAARMPLLHPAASSTEALRLRGITAQEPPFANNARTFDGARTAAFSQWVGGSHHVVFNEPRAAEMYADFLRSAADGAPVVDLAPREDDAQ